jgi:hypothetical protein
LKMVQPSLYHTCFLQPGLISPTFYAWLFLYESFVQSLFVLAVQVKLFIGARLLAQMRL